VSQMNIPIEVLDGFAAIPHGMKPTSIQTMPGVQPTATVEGWTAKGESDARYYDLYDLNKAHKTEVSATHVLYLVYTGFHPYTKEGFRPSPEVSMSSRIRVFSGNDESSEEISSYRAEVATWQGSAI
jgi:hypothetical protein